jgi:hypothetical protein
MLEATTTARLVDYATLEDRGALMASVQRSELESALHAGRWPDLWVEVADEQDETRRLTVELPGEELQSILEATTDDEIVFAFDSEDVRGLFDPEVEAHGFRSALAVAVVAGAIAAPAGLAATPQVSAAASPQVSGVAATAQVSNLAATAQVSNLAASAQVTSAAATTQVSAAAKPQIEDLAAKTQVSAAKKPQVAKLATKAQVASVYKLKAFGISHVRIR